MTYATTLAAPSAAVIRPRRRSSVSRLLADTAVIARRNISKTLREPDSLLDVTVMPVVLILLFGYVIGPAISLAAGRGGGYTSTGAFHSYLIPGMLGFTMVNAAGGSAVAIAADMGEGIVDRFRSLPMSRAGVLLGRSIADLAGLTMATSLTPCDAFVAAGAPWYLTLFGRDSIWAARMLLPLGTELALGTLRTLARRQGSKVDRVSNEEPGKILHELRQETVRHEAFNTGPGGEATLALPPVYYGTVDATPLWVCLLHDAWRWGLSESEVEQLIAPMERCLEWIAEYGCRDRPFVSYVDASGHGLANQGWKDSYDGIQFRDGRIATAPLALCEAQGYAYEAATHGAELLEAFGRPGAERWRVFADDLARRFRAAFWVEDSP